MRDVPFTGDSSGDSEIRDYSRARQTHREEIARAREMRERARRTREDTLRLREATRQLAENLRTRVAALSKSARRLRTRTEEE
jgi:hypothetical protein